MIKIKRFVNSSGEKPPMPKYQTTGAAAMDLCSFVERAVVIEPGKRCAISTGIGIELPHEYCGLVLGRSSLGLKYGVCPANGVGLIDSDYRGEIMVVLQNNGEQPFVVELGDRVAQLLITPVAHLAVEEATELSATQRGTGGFGSTGKK